MPGRRLYFFCHCEASNPVLRNEVIEASNSGCHCEAPAPVLSSEVIDVRNSGCHCEASLGRRGNLIRAQGEDAFDEAAFLFKGGYPELHARPEIDPHFWYGAYLTTYLERDVRSILNVGSLRDFDRFLRATAARTGQVLSYSDLARDVGITPNTAKKWISVLQASGQVFLLDPYFRNVGKRLVKSPKLYLCDTGLAAFLMGFENWQAVARHPAVGALWETHVVMEVVKDFASRGRSVPLWFWRTSQGEKVDMIIDRDGRFTAIECKYAEVVDESSLKGLRAFTRDYGPESVEARYIASRTPIPYPLTDGITALPGSRIADYLK